MQYDDLIYLVSRGMEYNFYYNNEEYWISQNNSGKYLTRSSDSYTQDFKNTDELFKYGKIDGKTIYDIWEDIKDQFSNSSMRVDFCRLPEELSENNE